jgi:hypothetical protein
LDTVRFRYVGDEPREVVVFPAGEPRLVQPDELITVPGDAWASYACQPALYEALDDDPQRADIDATLARVGDDPSLARAALVEERARPKPRTTLLAELEKRAEPPAPAGPPADPAAPADQDVTPPAAPAEQNAEG